MLLISADGGYDCSNQEELGSFQEFSIAIMLDRSSMEMSECKEVMVEEYAREN